MVSVAYMDPGNYGTDIQGGATFQLQSTVGNLAFKWNGHASPIPIRKNRNCHGAIVIRNY